MERREERIVREEPGPGGLGPGEPLGTSAETEVVTRFSPARRAYETIYLIFAVIVGAIVIRVVLKLLGANTAVAFTHFMYNITDPLLATLPQHICRHSSAAAPCSRARPLIAILIYGLVGIALARLIAIMFMRDVTVAHGSRSGRIRPNTD